MNDNHKTKEQLIKELEDLRRQFAELEKSESERKRAEEALRDSEEKYRSLSFTEDSMYFIDRECQYRFMNKAHLLRLGLSLDKVIGRSYGEFHSEEDTKKFADRVEAVFATGNSFQTEHRSERDNRYFLRTFSPVKDLQRNITDVTVISKDITERKRAEEALKTLSIKDDLTGLYNRRGFFALAEQGLKAAQRMGTEMLLIYGDLDNLKEINDTFGHKEGDQALTVISRILKETFRESDVLARIGGDEFVMLALNGLETSAEKLINRFEQVLNDHHLQTKPSYKLAMSFGIACFNPKNPSSIDALLVEADKLMYENKQKKVDRVNA